MQRPSYLELTRAWLMEATMFLMPANLLNILQDKRDDAGYYFFIIVVVHFPWYYLKQKLIYGGPFDGANVFCLIDLLSN